MGKNVTSISKDPRTNLMLIQYIQKILSYALLDPRKLLYLKQEIENGKPIIAIVREATGQHLILTHATEETLGELIKSIGSLPDEKGEGLKSLEKIVLDPNLSNAPSIESIGLNRVFTECLLDERRGRAIDEKSLDTLLQIWHYMFTSDASDFSVVYSLANYLFNLEQYFRNAPSTPSQVEYHSSALDNVRRYLIETEHEQQSKKLSSIVDSPDPERVADVFGIAEIVDGETKRPREESGNTLEFIDTIIWLLSEDPRLSDKYIRIRNHPKIIEHDPEVNDPNIKPKNLFRGSIEENQKSGALLSSIAARFKQEQQKAAIRYKMLERPGGIDLLMQGPKMNNKYHYFDHYNNNNNNGRRRFNT